MRSLATGICFLGFSIGGVVVRLLLPFAALLGIDSRRVMAGSFRWFLRFMWLMGIGRFTVGGEVEELPAEGAFVLVANHPTLIDVVFLLATVPNLCCVVHRRLFRSPFVGPVLRRGRHIEGPNPDDPDAPSVLDGIVERLNDGLPVLVFPEGTRSKAWSLNRFKRGAAEAAILADVPLVPVFLSCDPPTLMKGQPWWEVPDRRFHLSLEYLPAVHPGDDDSRAVTKALKEQYVGLVEAAKAASS
ncbi:MAG: 1-acyl-sn-glycerol-3-phosphate acyltransferase [Proteobacteria bacterium]|nr:1-acyl-sn-glycerol-3-phosphate acyltransferase [Pseudomonadota bacterium]